MGQQNSIDASFPIRLLGLVCAESVIYDLLDVLDGQTLNKDKFGQRDSCVTFPLETGNKIVFDSTNYE